MKLNTCTKIIVLFKLDSEPKYDKATVIHRDDNEIKLQFTDGRVHQYRTENIEQSEHVEVEVVGQTLIPFDDALAFLLDHCNGEVTKLDHSKQPDGTMAKVIDVEVSGEGSPFIVTLFESDDVFGIYCLDDDPVGSEDIPLRFIRHVVPPMLGIFELTMNAG